MKKSLVILSLATLLLVWCGWSKNVVEYNDSFVAVVKECTDSTQTLFDVFNLDGSTLDSVKESLNDSINACQNAQEKASKLWDFEKDSSLKDAVVDLLWTEVDYLQKFWTTSPYWNIENITDEDKVAYDSLVNELYQAEAVLNAKFTSLQQVQEGFAAKHGLKLE